MSVTHKTYSNKSNAMRAAKAQGLKNFRVDPTDTGFALVNLDRPLYNFDMQKKSEVDGPVGVVWDICLSNSDKTRQEILALCHAAGVTQNTAATQYSAWKRAVRAADQAHESLVQTTDMVVQLKQAKA